MHKAKQPDSWSFRTLVSVFFNRGCAGSQRYATAFEKVEERTAEEGVIPFLSVEKLDWLGKGLDKALMRFVRLARDARDQLIVMAYGKKRMKRKEESKVKLFP
jgi:hypothetical protein